MQELLTSLRLTALTVVTCCVLYPALLLGFARLAAPETAEGSLLRDTNGRVVGSRLVGQNFTRPDYFWPRPSAVDYNAAATGGSNLSPLSPKIRERAEEIIGRLRPSGGRPVPADLVTASGSGIDPHISLAAARFQTPRVARAREMSVEAVEELIARHTDAPALAALGGEPVVNVLELNLALDARSE